MDWFTIISRMYPRFWTKQMVGDGVYVGKITPEQYEQIVGEPYVEGPAPYSETEPV